MKLQSNTATGVQQAADKIFKHCDCTSMGIDVLECNEEAVLRRSAMGTAEVIGLLVSAMTTWPDETSVQRSCCSALTVLMAGDSLATARQAAVVAGATTALIESIHAFERAYKAYRNSGDGIGDGALAEWSTGAFSALEALTIHRSASEEAAISLVRRAAADADVMPLLVRHAMPLFPGGVMMCYLPQTTMTFARRALCAMLDIEPNSGQLGLNANGHGLVGTLKLLTQTWPELAGLPRTRQCLPGPSRPPQSTTPPGT